MMKLVNSVQFWPNLSHWTFKSVIWVNHPLNNNKFTPGGLARVKNMSFTAKHHVGNSDSTGDDSNEGEKTRNHRRNIIQPEITGKDKARQTSVAGS